MPTSPNRKQRRAATSKKGGVPMGKLLKMPKRMTLKRARKHLSGMRDDVVAFTKGREEAVEELAQRFLSEGHVGGRPCTTIEVARQCAEILFTPADELKRRREEAEAEEAEAGEEE